MNLSAIDIISAISATGTLNVFKNDNPFSSPSVNLLGVVVKVSIDESPNIKEKTVEDIVSEFGGEVTEKIKDLLVKNGYEEEQLLEKVHIIIGLIDNLCHEIIYHKHKNINYDGMTNITINIIKNLFKK